MLKKSAQDAYDELYKFFGLRGRDAYLNSIQGKQGSTSDKNQNLAISEIFQRLYSDSTQNPTFFEIVSKMRSLNIEEARKVFCVTPFDRDLPGNTPESSLPINSNPAGKYKEQGVWNDPKKAASFFTVKGLNPKKFEGSTNRIDVVQVFPVQQIPETADTDVLTLYLSTINNLNMSRAVPYVDVFLSVPLSGTIDETNAPFSLNAFLAGGRSLDGSAKFANSPETTTIESRAGFRQAGVASMEIFTSPQTLINSSKASYNQNTSVGTAIDPFRPFMAIESFSVRVVSSGAGVISNKTADMKLRLFDRGRLQQIAPIIAPSRFRAVQLDIEYGWSHPGGRTNVRHSDVNIEDRIGQLIDSMRVRESFIVANSNFSFEQDGSVSINLKLSMVGTSRLITEQMQFGNSSTDIKKIQDQLEEVKKIANNFQGGINIPQVLLGDADSFVSMREEDIAELNKALSLMYKTGTSPKLASAISKLIGNPKLKNDQNSLLKKFSSNRDGEIDEFIKKLRTCDDPFLRIDGISGGPSAKKLLATAGGGRNYVSLGTLMLMAFGENLQRHGNVLFTFGCFNSSAAAMYDHNVAQFPIKIISTDKGEFALDKILKARLKKIGTITPQVFMQIINEAFIDRQATDAYGLDQVFKTNSDPAKVAYANKNISEADEKSAALVIESLKAANLKSIYGGRSRPTFTVPRLNMRIDCKRASDGNNTIRVIVTDVAASNVGDFQRIFDEITTQGFFVKEKIPTSSKVRSAKHGEVSENVFETIRKSGLIEPWSTQDGTLLQKLNEMVKKNDPKAEIPKSSEEELKNVVFVKEFKTGDTKLREIFYDFYPTIIYGSMGSGIISAQLSSNQNDALTTINIIKQFNEGDAPAAAGLPMMIHPTQLSMDVFGSPLFKYAQTFFVDFGTGTSADNFYAVTGVDMTFSPGDFKCSLKLTQRDAFGRFMRVRDNALNALISIYKNETKKIAAGGRRGGGHGGGKSAVSEGLDKAAKDVADSTQADPTAGGNMTPVNQNSSTGAGGFTPATPAPAPASSSANFTPSR